MLVVGAVASGFVAAVPTHPAAPPLAHTGGFGEPTCAACHTGSPLNAFDGQVRVEGLPAAYEPGDTYALTVVLTAEETASAGFLLAARDAASGRTAGHLRSLDGTVAVTRSEAGVAYAHQTATGSVPASAGGTTWPVVWEAPSEGGAVAFHVAANSGNGDNSPLGDLVFTHATTVSRSRPPPHH